MSIYFIIKTAACKNCDDGVKVFETTLYDFYTHSYGEKGILC